VTATNRHATRPPGDVETTLLWGGLALAAAAVITVEVALRLGASLDGIHQHVPGNPITLISELAHGRLRWPAAGTLVAAVLAPALLAAVAAIAVTARRRRGGAGRANRAAPLMASRRDTAALSLRERKRDAARLGVDQPGLAIARAVGDGRWLYAGWEDVQLDIAGPRVGKTSARAIPAIVDAPGAVLATSNKRDIVDATRDVRAQVGPVWVFDPQQLVGEPAGWWWNPLTYVTDEPRARELAEVFAAAGRDPGARTDAYFEPAGQSLVANLLLAAACSRAPLGQVYAWLTSPLDDEAVQILAEHGYDTPAKALQAVIHAPEKQRGGIYGTALEMCSFMLNRQAMEWVTPHTWQPGLDVDELASDATATLYAISREGQGSCGPLVTALTVAVCDAAERHAARCAGGRLPVPMVVVLDEVANIVSGWTQLPNLYSHYGSRGICLMSFLQSWSQGAEVWGQHGMNKLWSAATVKFLGAGIGEEEFLERASKLIGTYQRVTTSTSRSSARHDRSSTLSLSPASILEVGDLAALPKDRAVVFTSGAPAVLVHPIPWWQRDGADAVRASIAAHDPAAPIPATIASDSSVGVNGP